jgi:hypothetical protein
MRPVRIVAGNSREEPFAIPAAGRRGRARMFALAAAAGLAVLAGTMTGATAAHAAASSPAHAAASVSADAATAAQSRPRFDPCPCDNPVCRPACFQTTAAGSPAATTHRQTHLTAAQPRPKFDPCPCDNPVCRPLCFQTTAAGGPAATSHQQTHLAAARTVAVAMAIAVNCPPPAAPLGSSSGQPSC